MVGSVPPDHLRRREHAEPERAGGVPPRPTAGPAPAYEQVLALQRGAGNAAVARALLARQEKPADADAAALAEVDKLPGHVLSGGGVKPLGSKEEKEHFVRAGREFFGDDAGTFGWFRSVRAAKVPGGILLHDSAATRLEAVAATMGTEMPGGGGGFQFRGTFSAATKYSRKSHHTLGLAVDYDANDMVRLGRKHTADLIEAVTGNVPHADLTDKNRRQVIHQMGEATEAGKDPTASAGGAEVVGKIATETTRLGQASADFQASLGKSRDDFLALRKEYFAAKTPADKKAVMDKVPAVVKPWSDAVDKQCTTLDAAATAAGFDPAKLPDQATVQVKLDERKAIALSAAQLRTRLTPKEGAPPPELAKKDADALAKWEQTLKLTPQPDAPPTQRAEAAATAARTSAEQLEPLLTVKAHRQRLEELKKMLTGDATFLFGGGPGKVADTPSMAQLVESGFFTPGTPNAKGGPDDRGNFGSKFIQEMAKHGFDAGFAWGGEDTDSMHFELVTPKLMN
jgi:hypothetical protein